MVAMGEFLPTMVIGIVIAIVPALALTIILVRGKGSLWKIFLFGWAGWLLALVIRIIPVQLPQQLLAPQLESEGILLLLFLAYASVMAGIFEEGIRYFILKRRPKLMANTSSILSFGLGWGIGEAIIIYVPAIASLPLLSPSVPTLLEILPGALERNLAIITHLALTLIVIKGISKGKIYLVLAMALHFLVNLVGVTTITLTGNAWFSELTLALAVGATVIVAYFVVKKG